MALESPFALPLLSSQHASHLLPDLVQPRCWQCVTMAGIPIICAVSAPSSLAVEVASHFGMTMVGFLREHRFNVYTHPERIVLDR